MCQTIISGYSEDASYLISSFESISSPKLFSHVLEFIPNTNSRILDIGAGTGRDAAWFSSMGHVVVAVEPATEFREAGKTLHPSSEIEWIDDSLPSLSQVILLKQGFELILLISVWQHVPKEDKLESLKNLRSIINKDARLIISIRNGPGSIKRKCYPTSAQETINIAQQCGFKLLSNRIAESIQDNNKQVNVTWSWLIFSTI